MSLAKVDDQWIPLQVKVFSRWVNAQLKNNQEIQVDDVTKDLNDGVALVSLAKELIGKDTPRAWAHKPRSNFDKVQNCDLSVDMFTKDGVRLVGISGKDVNDNNEKLILGYIWTLILHYGVGRSVSSDTKDNNSAAVKSDKNNKDALMQWAIERTSNYPGINNFQPYDLSLCALLDSYVPDKVNYYNLDPKDTLGNTKLANSVMSELGIPALVYPEELVSNNNKVDQKTLLTQLSSAKVVLDQQPTCTRTVTTTTTTTTIDVEAEKARKLAEEEAARKLAEEEAARKLADEQARLAQEEAARRANEEAEAHKRAMEESARREVDICIDASKITESEEDAHRQAMREAEAALAEAGAQRRYYEDQIKLTEERIHISQEIFEQKSTEQIEAHEAAEEASRLAEEQEAARAAAEESARQAAEEAARKAAEEEAARKAAEEAARRAAEEESRRAAEEAARKAAEQEAARKAAEEAARRAAEEEAAHRAAAEQARKAQEEAARKAAEEEAARKAAEAEARAIREAEEANRRAKEEARKAELLEIEQEMRLKDAEEALQRHYMLEEQAEEQAPETVAPLVMRDMATQTSMYGGCVIEISESEPTESVEYVSEPVSQPVTYSSQAVGTDEVDEEDTASYADESEQTAQSEEVIVEESPIADKNMYQHNESIDIFSSKQSAQELPVKGSYGPSIASLFNSTAQPSDVPPQQLPVKGSYGPSIASLFNSTAQPSDASAQQLPVKGSYGPSIASLFNSTAQPSDVPPQQLPVKGSYGPSLGSLFATPTESPAESPARTPLTSSEPIELDSSDFAQSQPAWYNPYDPAKTEASPIAQAPTTEDSFFNESTMESTEPCELNSSEVPLSQPVDINGIGYAEQKKVDEAPVAQESTSTEPFDLGSEVYAQSQPKWLNGIDSLCASKPAESPITRAPLVVQENQYIDIYEKEDEDEDSLAEFEISSSQNFYSNQTGDADLSARGSSMQSAEDFEFNRNYTPEWLLNDETSPIAPAEESKPTTSAPYALPAPDQKLALPEPAPGKPIPMPAPEEQMPAIPMPAPQPKLDRLLVQNSLFVRCSK